MVLPRDKLLRMVQIPPPLNSVTRAVLFAQAALRSRASGSSLEESLYTQMAVRSAQRVQDCAVVGIPQNARSDALSGSSTIAAESRRAGDCSGPASPAAASPTAPAAASRRGRH